jgi:peptide/nickel transport system substrate-binding protein
MKKILPIAVILVMLLSVILAGCTGSTTVTEKSPLAVQKITIGTTMSVSDINIMDSLTLFRKTLNMEQLVGLNSSGAFVPKLAQQWTTDDSKTWKFYLVKNATWHDGVPLTSRDVKFTIDYMQKKFPGDVSNYANQVESVETPDDHTVFITLKTPTVTALNTFAALNILPEHIYKNVDDPKKFNDINASISSGPYKLVKFDKDAGLITFEAYDNYYRGKPAVNTIELRLFKNSDTMAMALQKGEIDSIFEYSKGLSYYYVPKILQNPDIGFFMTQNYAMPHVLWFNTNKTPYDNTSFRDAISYAINYDEINNLIVLGYGTVPNRGFVPNGTDPYYIDTPQLSYNVNKSKERLIALGYIDRDGDGYREAPDGNKFRPELLIDVGNADTVRLATLLKTYFNNVGLDLKIDPCDADTCWDRAIASQHEMYIARTTPAGMKMLAGYGTLYFDKRADGYSQITDPKFTAIIDELSTTGDARRANVLSESLQQYYSDELPAIPLYWSYIIQPYNKKYEGWAIDPWYGVMSYETYYGLHVK